LKKLTIARKRKKQIDAKMKFTIRELVWFYDFVTLGRFVKVDTDMLELLIKPQLLL